MHCKSITAMTLGVAGAALCATAPVRAFDVTSGDWKFSVNGEVNAYYIDSNCQSAATAKTIDSIAQVCVGNASGSNFSNVDNGLLPADINFAVTTTQGGYDLGAHFGLYPGIATNDGGRPNLNALNQPSNVALGTTGLDVRQVYLTFGNKDVGAFTFGRNFGLFGFDAIINDMTLPGVGVGPNATSYASPANTTLGSIGFGYIYCDELTQMNYTTPTFSGVTVTIGIFNPLNSLTAPGTSTGSSAPGFHGKVTYTAALGDGAKLYLSSAFMYQKHSFLTGTATPTSMSFDSTGWDANVKFDISGVSLLASYYHGSGMGSAALYYQATDSAGNARDSHGYLLQATYTVGSVKFGVNYGLSELGYANAADQAADPALLYENTKFTGGVYYSMTKNLTLIAEVSPAKTQAHNGDENQSTTINAGAFLAF